MKLLALLAVLVSGTAHAEFETKFNLDYFQFAQNSSLSQKKITSGAVSIDNESRELRLTLNPAMNCPAGRFCAMVMPAPIVITLPILTTYHDRCGNSVISAEVDHRRVDGNKVSVQVVDSTASRCGRPEVRVARPVIVTLTSGGSRGVETTVSTLGGFRAEAEAEKGMRCRDVNAGPDHGYYASFSVDFSSVTVTSQSIMGPRPVASLVCEVKTFPVRGPERFRTEVICSDPSIVDDGYSLRANISKGLVQKGAQLFRVSKRGEELVANMSCR